LLLDRRYFISFRNCPNNKCFLAIVLDSVTFTYLLKFSSMGFFYLNSKANYSLLSSSKKRMKLTILSIIFTQDSEFRLFFGRIENIKICFRDLLTFKRQKISKADRCTRLRFIHKNHKHQQSSIAKKEKNPWVVINCCFL
jgi:hypothetical protein